jgi:type I restriction enzyme S subunit
MKYPAYPQLITTRWPETGKIPFGWEARRLKFSVSLRNEKIEAEDSTLDYMGLENIESWTGKRIEDETASSEGIATRFLKGDVLFGKLRPYLAKVYLAEREGMATTEALVFVSDAELIPRFLKYLLISEKFIEAVSGTTYGAKMPRANWEAIGGLPILLPTRDEQQQIAAFLDWKTGQIDALIARKQELLERLKEKRIAVISQAVTKGLNPAAPMRDPGIPWLGQVPKHWIVKRLRYCAALVTSGSRGWAQYFSDSGELFLRITNLDRESIELLLEDIQRVDPPEGAEGARTLSKEGDLLISITADLGSVAVIPPGLEPAYVSQHLSLVRLDTTEIDPNWIAYSVFSHAGKFQLRIAGYGGTKVQLSLSDIKEIGFCYPPTLEEQRDILDFIRTQTKRIEDLIDLASQAIALLTEYRTALITSATTGKIDVRNVKIPKPAA